MLIGIKASVKTRYGKLCCEPSGTAYAHSAAYVNVSNETGVTKWAQTGFARERQAGTTVITTFRYAEMMGKTYYFKKGTAPAKGETHAYQCDLDMNSGTWSFSYDGTVWQTLQNDFWKTATGTAAIWSGEIFNIEDDMPGTATNKCNFTGCQYDVDGIYQDAGFISTNVNSSDSNQWGAEWISGTAFNIWDKNPL